MSVSVCTDLHCDSPHCNNWVRGVVDTKMNLAGAKAEAKKAGWIFIGKRHYCDYCAEHEPLTAILEKKDA